MVAVQSCAGGSRWSECDVDVLKSFEALSFRLARIGLTISRGELYIIGEGVSSARGYNRSTRTTLTSAHSTKLAETKYKNAKSPSTSANTLLVALADFTVWASRLRCGSRSSHATMTLAQFPPCDFAARCVVVALAITATDEGAGRLWMAHENSGTRSAGRLVDRGLDFDD